MTENQFDKREAALKKAGYHESGNTSFANDYSWFKTVRDPDDPEEWLYMIEWQVWNWLQYADRDSNILKHPYSMSLKVIVNIGDCSTSELSLGDILDIPAAEEMAKDFYEFIKTRLK